MTLKDIPNEMVQWIAAMLTGLMAFIAKIYHGRLQKLEDKQDEILQVIHDHEEKRLRENPTITHVDTILKPINENINNLHTKLDDLNKVIITHLSGSANGNRK